MASTTTSPTNSTTNSTWPVADPIWPSELTDGDWVWPLIAAILGTLLFILLLFFLVYAILKCRDNLEWKENKDKKEKKKEKKKKKKKHESSDEEDDDDDRDKKDKQEKQKETKREKKNKVYPDEESQVERVNRSHHHAPTKSHHPVKSQDVLTPNSSSRFHHNHYGYDY